jgi:uncharacterized membrane protein
MYRVVVQAINTFVLIYSVPALVGGFLWLYHIVLASALLGIVAVCVCVCVCVELQIVNFSLHYVEEGQYLRQNLESRGI